MVFLHYVIWFCGLPDDSTEDKNAKFSSIIWIQLTDVCGIQLKISTSHHLQTDEYTKSWNRIIEYNIHRFSA